MKTPVLLRDPEDLGLMCPGRARGVSRKGSAARSAAKATLTGTTDIPGPAPQFARPGTWFPRSTLIWVFVTKYRRGVLDAGMLHCCEDATRKVCGDFGAELREFNGEDDHVHLVEYPPKVAVSALVNSLKGVSARRLRSQFTGRVNRTSCTGISGRRPTSPHPAAALP
jgi:REP element-mobilizing transposase RayT